ncbi:MAG: diaminopimelate decarboxylase [Alphaproteobacteria bacterium]|nr:diaminopimelate decarboxylase [Alphaproteobacteria bacterium]
MHYFEYKDGELFAEDVSLAEIAEQVGTPFYCYSAATFRRHIKMFQQSFADRDALICYAMKANSNQAVLTLIAKLGAGVDVVSGGEMKRAILAGFPADKIVYSGVAKTHAEIEYGLEIGIHCFNAESEPELIRINEIAKAKGVKAPVSVRVNPDVDAGGHEKIMTGKAENKFGIPWKKIDKVYELIGTLAHLEVVGIDLHIGSQITDLEPFAEAFERVGTLVTSLRAAGHNIQHVDFGGGLGVPYKNDNDIPPHPDEYAAMINKVAGSLGVKYIFEPGRMIAANAGILVGKVEYVKHGDGRDFLISDVGMNDLIRPTLYDAYHDILPVKQATGVETQLVDVVGPVCETGDYTAKGRELPVFEQGELFAIMSAGAYGAVQAGTYNTRALVPEVLVDDDRFAVVRKRVEVDEIIALDDVPDWL